MIKLSHIAAILLGSCMASQAATITLLNGNFEGGASASDLDPNSWTVSTEGNNNVYAYTAANGITTTVLHFKDNSDTALSSISQNLSANNVGLQAGSYSNYTVTLDLGWRTDRTTGGTNTGAATLRFELYDVTTPTTVYGSTEFILAQRATPLNNSYALIHDDLEINIANTGTGSGQIGLRILRVDADNTAVEGDSTMWMDNLSVTAVPEPSAALLGGLGLLALLRRRR